MRRRDLRDERPVARFTRVDRLRQPEVLPSPAIHLPQLARELALRINGRAHLALNDGKIFHLELIPRDPMPWGAIFVRDFLGVSLGDANAIEFQGAKLEATVRWIAARARCCCVLVGDSLGRISLEEREGLAPKESSSEDLGRALYGLWTTGRPDDPRRSQPD